MKLACQILTQWFVCRVQNAPVILNHLEPISSLLCLLYKWNEAYESPFLVLPSAAHAPICIRLCLYMHIALIYWCIRLCLYEPTPIIYWCIRLCLYMHIALIYWCIRLCLYVHTQIIYWCIRLCLYVPTPIIYYVSVCVCMCIPQ
jgi:hypothetical protein